MRVRTVGDLIALLEQYPDDAEVRLGTQPSWPLQYHVAGVASDDELPDRTDEFYEAEDAYDADVRDGETKVVWIVEGYQLRDEPYAPRSLWEVAS